MNFEVFTTSVELQDIPSYTTNITLEGQTLRLSFLWNERLSKRVLSVKSSTDVTYLQNTILYPNESFDLNSNAVFDDLPYKVVLQKTGDTNRVGNLYTWSKDFIIVFYRTVDVETVKLNVRYGVTVSSTPVVPKPVQAPLDNPHVRVLELQYYDAVQLATESEVNADLAAEPTLSRVAVVAPRGQQNAVSAEIYVDSGSGYASKATLDYCPSAELAQTIGKMESTFAIRKVEDLEEIELGKWILVNDEHMAVTAISETEITVKRGVNYTVPQDHPTGSMILFCDDYIALDETDYFAGESLNVKSLTKTGSAQLALGSATAHSIEMVGLANRPYPPANVKINGGYWSTEIETDLVLTWVDRNRIQQTGGSILGWFDGGVAIEPDTQTHLTITQFDEDQVELATNNANVTGSTSYTFAISAMQADARTVEIVLKTIRDGYECLNPFVHTVELPQFFSAPYDLTVEFKND